MRDSAFANRQDVPALQLEKPRIVQFPRSNSHVPPPEPRTVQLTPVEQEAGEPFIAFRLRWIIAIFGVALSVAFLLWASGYIIRKGHREIGVREPAPIAVAESSTIPLAADVVHVSAIALGKIKLAMVNGEALREGDSLRVKTPEREAVLRVTRIEDGAVRFKYGSQTIDVRISTIRMH